MENQVRILRVLEYIGPRDKVERNLDNRTVKGTMQINNLTIRDAIVGEWPEPFEQRVSNDTAGTD